MLCCHLCPGTALGRRSRILLGCPAWGHLPGCTEPGDQQRALPGLGCGADARLTEPVGGCASESLPRWLLAAVSVRRLSCGRKSGSHPLAKGRPGAAGWAAGGGWSLGLRWGCCGPGCGHCRSLGHSSWSPQVCSSQRLPARGFCCWGLWHSYCHPDPIPKNVCI